MYTSRPKAPLCPVTVYLCEDTIDGIFTAIYRAWADGTSPVSYTHLTLPTIA